MGGVTLDSRESAPSVARDAGSDLVQLHGAVCLLGGFPALAGLDLTVGSGEIVGLRGPNGAGKSTLLRLCAGLLHLSRGDGSVVGHDVGTKTGRQGARRLVGLLGHATSLYDDLTVEQNVRFWARANRVDTTDMKAAMDHLGISGRLASVPVGGLSAGQRRRTALAILIARRPRLWLLDEPHAGLDNAGRDLLDQLMMDAAQAGATIMVATHDAGRIDDILTRTVTVHGGVVTADSRSESNSGGPAAAYQPTAEDG